jgi:hypothetical protein
LVRNLKPQIHIFFPEASNRGNRIDLCEYFYIKHSYQRRVNNAKIVPYAESFEKDFNQALRNALRRRSTTSHDLFFIVLDTDISANRANASTIISQIHRLSQKYNNKAKIILSGRSFEVWLCMYGRQQFTTPYTTQSNLNSDVDPAYEKKEPWYLQNAERLYIEYPNARNASILSKQNVFVTTSHPPPIGHDLINDLPDFSNIAVVTYLVNTTPFTYIEHLIDTLRQYE